MTTPARQAILTRVEEGAARALAGQEAPELARDLAALAHADPLTVIAEVTSPAELALAVQLGAQAIRLEADLAVPRDALRACLLVPEVHDRPVALEALRALTAERAAPYLETELDARVVLGARSAADYLPRSLPAAVEVGVQAGLTPGKAAAAVAAIGARSGRLGSRGARWLAEDLELFGAIAGGFCDAARQVRRSRVTFVVPAVAYPGELEPARRLLERLAAELALEGPAPALQLCACVEAPRGVLAIDAIERAADFVEMDLDALAETSLVVAREDAACLGSMIEKGHLPHDPFADLDPALATLLAAVRRPDRAVVVRGACVLGPRTLGRLEDLAVAGVSVPARAVAAVRVAHARRAVQPSVTRRASELSRLVSAAPRSVSPGPPPIPEAVRPRDLLDEVVTAVSAGQLSPTEALNRVPAVLVDALARPVLDERGRAPLTVGLGVAPGAGVGRVALSPARVQELSRAGEPAVLLVREVYGDEAAAVPLARGLISSRGGRTSHAAIVAANCGVPCVIAEQMVIGAGTVSLGKRTLSEGAWISIDGSTGAIHDDRLSLAPGANEASFAALMGWSDAGRRLKVLANADTPEAIAAALAHGAQGIGLVRTENMFLAADAIEALQVALLGERDTQRLEALQGEAFAAQLAAARGAPVTFRLLDASLFELLPHDRDGVTRLARLLGLPLQQVAARVDAARPIEPAMSLRLSRLALERPEIERAQVGALVAAWLATPGAAPLKILVPMIVSGADAAAAASRIRAHAAAAARRQGSPPPPVEVGAMMETPRAALDAAAIAQAVDFFAWGSNDLTQFTLGIARSVFPIVAPNLGGTEPDPSESLDLGGVGALIHLAETVARAANPKLATGVCGNLATDPRSIRAFDALGLDYVSVPAAQLARVRLAAAQS
jgi:phosphoenolpyruvate-protein kinase (PTS system EI component)